jgi:hypothetical protein
MKRLVAVPFLIYAGFATSAAAQSVDGGFYTNGYAELSYSDGAGTDSETLGVTETTLGYTDPNSGFGFELGIDAIVGEGDDEAAIYGAGTYQSSFGKLSLGAPRPALDAYLSNVPDVAGLQFLNFGTLGLTKRSLISSSYLLGNEGVPVGLRYDGTFGATNIGASYHRFDDADVFNLAGNYQFGQTTLTGAIEHVSDSGFDETRYFLGVESKFGQVTAGLLYSGNFVFSDDAAVEAYAKFKPLDQLELTASALNLDTGSGSSTLYGLEADYTLNQGIYLKAGVADDLESGSDTAYNLGLGLRF